MSEPDIRAIRQQLQAAHGDRYWRGLEELSESPGFTEFLHHEFPRLGAVWEQTMDRRSVLKLLGANMALAGLSGCVRPAQETVPYVEMPERIVPGEADYYATTLTLGGYGRGALVESHTGRPTKVEGNADHPASLGATDVFGQAALLQLYDPDRSDGVVYSGQIASFERFLIEFRKRQPNFGRGPGHGLRLLTGPTTSSSLRHKIKALLKKNPDAQWHVHDPVERDSVYAGARLAYGEAAETVYHLDKAQVVLSLDADFLNTTMPGHLAYARRFMDVRRVREQKPARAVMNRLYVLESTPSITGASADHRLPVRAGRIETVARALAHRLGVKVDEPKGEVPVPERWLDAAVRDLKGHRGRAPVLVGATQPAVVHALAHAMNEQLGNVGRSVIHIDPLSDAGSGSLEALARDMMQDKVDTLILLETNPVYTAPADIDFRRALDHVKLSVHLSNYYDETAVAAHWHIPAAHELESWGDARAFDGTESLIQPLIKPLHDGFTSLQLLAILAGDINQTAYAALRDYWRERHGSNKNFNVFWRASLRKGVVEDTASKQKKLRLRNDFADRLPQPSESGSGLEIQYRADPVVWDGGFANNSWLQELPRPLTKLTWGNAALIAPATAEKLGLASGEMVELSLSGGRRLEAPVWILPGQPADAVTLHLGYGRDSAGGVGNGVGVNAYRLRGRHALWSETGLRINKTGRRTTLATTQLHHSLEGRDMVRGASLDAYRANPGFATKPEKRPSASLYSSWENTGPYAWGMVVDVGACIGCNACVIACQAENNIPVVGKKEVERGHEMHWLRVDRYYRGELDAPETVFQPVPCMQCENAPCEYVCPVEATVHSRDGLNQMIYNRCIGTRNCSQNCPYKVRRFNWYDYMYLDTPVPEPPPMHNPDVTVRSRGVMEKCTYCVQRIRRADIKADKENRQIRDGEVQTACQQVCPTDAIVFGNLNDAASQVARLAGGPLNYAMLAELNTRPHTTYLAAVKNPNPEIVAAEASISGRWRKER